LVRDAFRLGAALQVSTPTRSEHDASSPGCGAVFRSRVQLQSMSLIE
jgi:hypothetical protein